MVIDAQFIGSEVNRANHKTLNVKKGESTQDNGEYVVHHFRTEENTIVGLGVFVIATRDIDMKEEIFLDYGPW